MLSNNISGPKTVRSAQTKTTESKQFDQVIRTVRTGTVDQYYTDDRKDDPRQEEHPKDNCASGSRKPLEPPALLSFPVDLLRNWIDLFSRLLKAMAGEQKQDSTTSAPTASALLSSLRQVFSLIGGFGTSVIATLFASPMTLIKRPFKAIAEVLRRRD